MSAIQHYTVWATDNVVKQAINKIKYTLEVHNFFFLRGFPE
jgi:hypothetical protein